MFYKKIQFDVEQFNRDGFAGAELYDFFKGWRQGYDWTIPCDALVHKFNLPITIFDQDLYLLFVLTFKEYFDET